MTILSIDVGIKNLALCLLSKNKEILMWEVLDISIEYSDTNSEEKKQTYSACSLCKNKAKYRKTENFYCLRHAKESGHLLPTKDLLLSKIEKMKLNQLKELVDNYSIDMSTIEKSKKLKSDYISAIKNSLLETLGNDYSTKVKASEVSLIDISRNMTAILNRFLEPHTNIDSIIIENQISPIATRMTSIQGMLTQYFIMKNPTQHIQYISAKNKLKDFDVDKHSYKERKSGGIDICKSLLNPSWCAFLSSHKKKDDLADCYLQGIWYINNLSS